MSAKAGLFEHFRKLADFRGREDRGSFWPYAALVFGISMVGTWAVMIPVMMTTMTGVQKYAAEHPEQVNVVSSPGQYSVSIEGGGPELMPDFSTMISGMAIVILIVALLYAAAVTRRLHDRNMSGWWGLMPVPFLTYSLTQMSRFFHSAIANPQQPDLNAFFSIFISNMLYLVALITLIVLLAGAGDPKPNRFDLTE